MQYTNRYSSPLGSMMLASDGQALTGLWFEGQKYFAYHLGREHTERELPVFGQAKQWLGIYFSGKEPGFQVPLHFTGTAFQNEVWEILCGIPYGRTVTYGGIAKQLAERKGTGRVSARSVGGAVGHNPISILVPCHRVIGANGSLTGYAGGMARKQALLELENILAH